MIFISRPLAIALILAFFISCENEKCKELPEIFLIDHGYQLDETFTELEIKPKIYSLISCEAYLIVGIYKEYRSLPSGSSGRFEGFKDSLIIDGFNVRTYGLSVNDPIFIKKISLKKGVNPENFKVVLPKNYYSIATIRGDIGILRIDDEIKRNFENFPGDYKLTEWEMDFQKKFFEIFPDSSKTALVFSNSKFLRKMSILDRNEYTERSKCFPKRTPYSNFNSIYLIINWLYPDGKTYQEPNF